MSSKGSIGLPWDTNTTGISGVEVGFTIDRLSGCRITGRRAVFSIHPKPEMAVPGLSRHPGDRILSI